jgi:hypothetical protein
MNWYVATLIVQCRVADQAPSTCDEPIRLVLAADADAAYDKAIWLGKGEEVSYLNMYGEEVRWEFVGLENLEMLEDDLHDRVEIRSRLFACGDPTSRVTAKADLSVFAARSNPHSSEYRGPDWDSTH